MRRERARAVTVGLALTAFVVFVGAGAVLAVGYGLHWFFA